VRGGKVERGISSEGVRGETHMLLEEQEENPTMKNMSHVTQRTKRGCLVNRGSLVESHLFKHIYL